MCCNMIEQPTAQACLLDKIIQTYVFGGYQMKSTKLILIPPDPMGREPGNQLHAALSLACWHDEKAIPATIQLSLAPYR